MTITRSNIPSGMYPLSSAQNRIWFMENLNEGTRAYNDPYDFKITGKLDVTKLNQSIQILIERHESFRTIFSNEDGQPQQKILSVLKNDLEIISLESEPEEKVRERLAHYSLINGQRKFDLTKGPLFYFGLLILGKDQYIFLLNFHHIISDAFSVRIFLDELLEVYHSLVENKTPELPEIPVTYKDFAVWENTWLTGDECRKQVDFWKNELLGVPDMLQLPMDMPRPRVQQFRGAEYHFSVDETIRRKLHLICKKHGTSMLVPMLSAFGVMLSKYSLQDDLVIGVPVANRAEEELQTMIGVLINTLPIRIKLDHTAGFSDLVGITGKKFMNAYENQGVPFDRLAEELKVKRSLNSSPIFQVLFNYLTSFRDEMRIPDLSLQMLPGERRVALVDLTLTVYDQQSHADCVIQYDSDLFNHETIERMAGHYLTILNAIVADENIRIGDIPLLTQQEKDLMLEQWNETGREYPKDKCAHQMFEAQAALTPDLIAVEDDHGSLTYKELNERANRLASWLVQKGAGEGTSVALFVERGIDMLVGMQAIVKSGAAFLPLDPIYPKPRLELIVEDAKPVLFLTQRKLNDKIPSTGAGIIFMDDHTNYDSQPGVNLQRGNPRMPAYLLYTSGSTGIPKGVPILHSAVVNLVSFFRRMLKVTEKDVMLSVTTIAFDIAELEMYLPLFSGAKVVIASQETVMDMSLLIERIRNSGATLFQATPVTYKMLLLNNWSGKAGLKVITGGEALSKELARALLERCDEVWNSYGPTETAIYSTSCNLTREDTEGDGFSPIGFPLDNTSVYVLNSHLVPVPVGIPGELYIGGEGLSPGYLNLPETTDQRFIPDHLSGKTGGRLYKTGDLVRYFEDGRLVFLNRIDSQVKIRGFRIELGEIESILAQFSGIRESVVALKEDVTGEKMLIAYYIPDEGMAFGQAELKLFIKERLPDYMVPSAFMKMEKFPLTSNNKIDRKLLPEPDNTAKPDAGTYIKPETPTEKKLAKIWELILKVDKMGIHEDFFESGGHSMIAVTLIIKIEKEFGIRIPLATLFERSTIHSMAELLDQGAKKVSEKWRSLVSIRPEGHKKPLFLVHGLGLNVLLYTTIVNLLDPEQPIYGLQAKGLNGLDAPLETIEAIAAYYISEIMTIEKEGPYNMAGFSFGGKIAFEMARQLTDMGKSVSFLGLFDTVADGQMEDLTIIRKNSRKISHMVNYLSWNVKSLFTENNDDSPMQVMKRKWKGLERKIVGMDLNVKKVEQRSNGTEDELPEYLTLVHRANTRADKQYVIRPYNGTVHLFRARNQTFYIEDPVNYGWDKYALGGVIIHEIPGEHSSIFAPPNDQYFADILQQHLNVVHDGMQIN